MVSYDSRKGVGEAMTQVERKFKNRRAPSYSDLTIETCLKVLVLCGGNATEAAKVVKSKLPKGAKVPPANTISTWRRELFPTDYARLESEMHEQRAKKAASQSEAIIIMASTQAMRALESLEDVDYSELRPVERSKVVENLSRVAATHFEKISSPVRGRPTTTVGVNVKINEALRRARNLPGIQVVDTTAEELHNDIEEIPQTTTKEKEM